MHSLKRKTKICEKKRGIWMSKISKWANVKKNKTRNLISLTLADMKEKTVRETTQKRITFCISHWVHICYGDNGYQGEVK